jgi:hypothetical protein
VLQEGVQEELVQTAVRLREVGKGVQLDQHPLGQLLYHFGMATNDPVHNPELFRKVWPCEEE